MPNFLYLPGWEVTDVKPTDEEYVATATYKPEPTTCPKCGVVGELYRHGTKVTDYRDAPVHGKQVTIQTTRRRYRCRACKATFLQPLPDIDDDRRMTVRCRDYIRDQGLLKPFTHVARDIGIDEKTVRKIAWDHIETLNAEHHPAAPRVLGIDELTLLRKRRAIFVDIDGRRPLDLLEDHSRPVVQNWLQRLRGRNRIEVVSIDMWKPYKEAVRTVLGEHVAIVVDKFHVVRMASDAMETIRKATQRGMQDKERRRSKRSRYLLLRRPINLSAQQAFSLDGWLKNDPDIYAAYDAKEAFYGIYDAPDREEAEAAYDMWLHTLTPELKVAFKPLTTAMKNWRVEVFNYFDHRVTNAFTEGVNGIVKIANRMGRGYSFEVIRARLLFRGVKPGATTQKCDICHAEFEIPGVVISAHIVPKSMGGSTTPANVIRVCRNCHRFHTEHWFKRADASTRKSE